jgi:hypothetical protein
MKDTVEERLARVLEPDEKVIWTGRPNVDTVVDAWASRRKRAGVVIIVVIAVAGLWGLSQRLGGSIPDLLDAIGPVIRDPENLVALAVPILLVTMIYVFKLDNRSSLNRYLHSLGYAITNRRLLVLEGDKLKESYPPERLRMPRVDQRAPGYADVIFGKRRSGSRPSAGGPVARERRHVGFKALPNAREIMHLIDQWLSDYLKQGAEDVAEFVEVAERARLRDPSSAIQRIRFPEIGLELAAPAQWTVRVRWKKKPQGKFFLDREDWRELSAADRWNVVEIEGPRPCKLEIEAFATEPTVTFEELAQSKLASSTLGPVVDADAELEINGLRGFCVTHRSERRMDPATNESFLAAIVAPLRFTVLHDGRHQVFVTASWPENSSVLQRAVDAVVESIRIPARPAEGPRTRRH